MMVTVSTPVEMTCNWEDQEEHQEYNHVWVLGLGFGVWIFGFGVQGPMIYL
jgi:hypothetical protein